MTANTDSDGADATFAHNERATPTRNANHARHFPTRPGFHNSTVAVINGQIIAVAASAPNRNANACPCL